ncbi:gamma-glutamylcyclotransferase [Sphingomonas sp. dw_22]|uniref:gamma-glutamylcyclotransferase n=1 Tax=Sphingomonas sp. dw_22 TaxID=2721175 RepID=UPI0021161831|nr:gamma-glutamylcyclotransferase [Sphingomonas sp. dw_22]
MSTPEHRYRALLESGDFATMLASDAPGQRLLTDAERSESLRCTLASRPAGPAWVFAYGSLVWNPTIRSVERRVAHIDGWHRAFCLTSPLGRGSPDRPGLVLALEEGGSCEGVALRLDEADVVAELELLWRREMVTGAYVPRWMDLLDSNGERVGAGLAFTIDPASANYAGDLPHDRIVERLATARGSLGSSADYLFQTRDGLRACGIPDAEIEQLAAEVEAALNR